MTQTQQQLFQLIQQLKMHEEKLENVMKFHFDKAFQTQLSRYEWK